MTDQAAREAKAATSAIPILFALGADPVADGLVRASTGPAPTSRESSSFRLSSEPNTSNCCTNWCEGDDAGVLAFPASPEDRTERSQIEAATRHAGQHVFIADAVRESEIDAAFATFAEKRIGAVLVGSGPFFRSHKQQIVALAARYALPACFSLREYAKRGAS